MLQEFYKDTIQSNYIKYILNNIYIPTVPFTNNINHITKGNTYIHEGYFVTAKVSDAIQAIKEDIKSNPSLYNKYFIKNEPYVFGRQYFGLTTNYKSNTKGYDSTTHYYLGEYLRAYKAYYGIDLMPFYNCYSNEYVDYLYLKENSSSKSIIIDTKHSNPKYKIISVPIKFCAKYTIAIQCTSEVMIAPALIGKKGLLEEKTNQLYMIDKWGKRYPRIEFNKPIIYESPHINSINDLTQSSLQTYDKYLRLLIQVPANNESSVVVLEGEYSNTAPFATKNINTSHDDIIKTYATFYDTKLPYSNNKINVPKQSYLKCNDINSQRYCFYLDNNIITLYQDENDKKGNNLSFNIDTKLALPEVTLKKYLIYSNPINIEVIQKDDKYEYKVPIKYLCHSLNEYIHSYDDNDKVKETHYYIYINKKLTLNDDFKFDIDPSTSSNDNIYTVPSTAYIIFKRNSKNDENSLPLNNIYGVNKGDASRIISQILFDKGNNEWKVQYKFIYLNKELLDSNKIDIKYNSQKIDYELNSNILTIPLNNNINSSNIGIIGNAKYISLADSTHIQGEDNWELISQIDNSLFNLNNYLNKYLISNLVLLNFNNHISYAFSGRLIEYLVGNVISSKEMIPKNIKRVQQAVNFHNEGDHEGRSSIQVDENDI